MKNLYNYTNQSVISRYSKENNISFEVANNNFNALLKFLKTCSISKYPCYPDEIIDEVWHNFILFTKDYQEFCTNYLGKFIHHIPIETDEAIGKGYFCFIDKQNGKWNKKLVRSRQEIADCGSGGNCNSCGSGGNCSSCSN